MRSQGVRGSSSSGADSSVFSRLSTSSSSSGSLLSDIFGLLSYLVNAEPNRSERRPVNCACLCQLQEKRFSALLIRWPLEQDHAIGPLTRSQAPRAQPEILNGKLFCSRPACAMELRSHALAA